MSNKTQLQTNNTQYASLIETLRGKAVGGGGEDVAAETEAYTTKLASLETAISALESELEGKASGSSGGANIETCTIRIEAIAVGTIAYAMILGANGDIDSIAFEAENFGAMTSATILCENVICNSILYIDKKGIKCTTGSAYRLGTGDKEYWSVFKAPNVAGEACILST